jgi:hypothetical protein
VRKLTGESEESSKRFGEVLGPLAQEVGIASEPELYPARVRVSLSTGVRPAGARPRAQGRSAGSSGAIRAPNGQQRRLPTSPATLETPIESAPQGA